MLMTPLIDGCCAIPRRQSCGSSPLSVTLSGLVSGDLWGMKLNESKTKTMIVSLSLTMHPQSPQLIIFGTVLKEFDVLVILRVTFDSKMTFEKHLRWVSRAASPCYREEVLASVP